MIIFQKIILLFIIIFFLFVIFNNNNILRIYVTKEGLNSSIGSSSNYSNDADKISRMNTAFSNVKQNDNMLSVYFNDYIKQNIRIEHNVSITQNMLNLCEIMKYHEIIFVNANLPLGFYRNQYLIDPIASNIEYNTKNKTNIDDETLLLNNVSTILNYHNSTINNIKQNFKDNMITS